MIATYTVKTPYATYRGKIIFHSWEDEPYPPGGFLRVMRDETGRIVAGPLVSEIVEWVETPC
jgi:hypothetical protein